MRSGVVPTLADADGPVPVRASPAAATPNFRRPRRPTPGDATNRWPGTGEKAICSSKAHQFLQIALEAGPDLLPGRAQRPHDQLRISCYVMPFPPRSRMNRYQNGNSRTAATPGSIQK